MLEVQGGCRHDWKPLGADYSTCKKCHLWMHGDLPNVVDGHPVTMEEMLNWLGREYGAIEILLNHDTGTWYVRLFDNPSAEGVTALDALAQAIIAGLATDGQ